MTYGVWRSSQSIGYNGTDDASRATCDARGIVVPHRRQPQAMKPRFSIRDLLWLAVVVVLSVGWWTDRAVIRKEREDLDRQRVTLENDKKVVDAAAWKTVRQWQQQAIERSKQQA